MSNTPNNNAASGSSDNRPVYYARSSYLPGPSGSQPYGAWGAPTAPYSYATPMTVPYGYPAYASTPLPPSTAQTATKIKKEEASQEMPPPAPAPASPVPSFTPDWDSALKTFLVEVGLTEALRGFRLDMLAMNPTWEQAKVPPALAHLIGNVKALSVDRDESVNLGPASTPLEDRKLNYVELGGGETPVPPSTLTKSISTFLAQNRSRNDASNRAEFLLSLEEKYARRDDAMDVDDESSCARTDAKHVDRSQQIKYDVAKNDDHLRRTTKKQSQPSSKGKDKADVTITTGYTELDERVSADRHPGLDTRLNSVESHLAVRYVPSPPVSLLARLKLLEDHIIRLEKEYPPWAALHFNQPNRDWPPPPPSTSLIVPPHIQKTSKVVPVVSTALQQPSVGGNRNQSSLHKAVMERLEVQKAMKAKNTV